MTLCVDTTSVRLCICLFKRMPSEIVFLLTRLTDISTLLNPLTPNDTYSGRTAPLTSKRCILYICSTNIGTEYFKHGIHSPFFPLQNAVCFIILTYLVPVLFRRQKVKIVNGSAHKRRRSVE